MNLLVLLPIYVAVLVWSLIRPHDYLTWSLESLPAIVGVVVLAVTWRRFPLTPLVYALLLVHAVILFVGGHYTYAEVPLFDWIRDALGQSRNNYDKVGHFAQGFIPAMVARELLVRQRVVAGRSWLAVIVVAICLAISALYELVEWMSAVILGSGADAFLGTQGDPWDTQSDMGFALLGAICALTLLSRVHDRQLAAIRLRTGDFRG